MLPSRRYAVIALALIAVALVASCAEDDDDVPAPDPTGVQTPTTTEVANGPDGPVGRQIAAGNEPVALAFTPDGRMLFTERRSGEIRIVTVTAPPELATLPVVEQAKIRLAEAFEVDVVTIETIAVVPQDWPDSCLGLGEQGEACAEVVTAGYQVILSTPEIAGAAIFRTDESSMVRLERVRASRNPSEVFADVSIYPGHPECGLLGIAVDPEFETNGYVYVYATHSLPGEDLIGQPRVIRFTEANGLGEDPTVIVGDLPTTNPEICAHVGGNLHFGPDGYLYLTIGNTERTDEAVASDLSSPLGKILRMNRDGSAAADNPFIDDPDADPRVFAYGLRNTWDFAFQPETGQIYAPDNGQGNCDELNLIEAGSFYGVPRSLAVINVSSCFGLGGIDPIHLFSRPGVDPTEFGSNTAPAGVAWLDSDLYPSLEDGLLVCHFNTGAMELLTFGGPDGEVVEGSRDIADCRPNVEVWEGRIYYIDGTDIFELPPEAIED